MFVLLYLYTRLYDGNVWPQLQAQHPNNSSQHNKSRQAVKSSMNGRPLGTRNLSTNSNASANTSCVRSHDSFYLIVGFNEVKTKQLKCFKSTL